MASFIKKLTGAEARERVWDNMPHPVPDAFKPLLAVPDGFVHGKMFVDDKKAHLRTYRAAILSDDKESWRIFQFWIDMKGQTPQKCNEYKHVDMLYNGHSFFDYEDLEQVAWPLHPEDYDYECVPWILKRPEDVLEALRYIEGYRKIESSAENASVFAARHGYHYDGERVYRATVSNIHENNSVFSARAISKIFGERSQNPEVELKQWSDIQSYLQKQIKKREKSEPCTDKDIQCALPALKQIEYFASLKDKKNILELKDAAQMFLDKRSEVPQGLVRYAYQASMLLAFMNLSSTCMRLACKGDLVNGDHLMALSRKLAEDAETMAERWFKMRRQDCSQVKDIILTGPNPDQLLPLRRLIMERGADQYPPAPPPPSP